jgi:Na+-driven multidrug efflux pump
MARRFGEDRPNEIGRTFSNAFFLLFAIVTVVFVSIKLAAPSLITNLVSNHDIATLVGDFVQVRIWGLFFAAFMLLFRAFYVATANTKVLIAVTSTTVGLNIILNYALIFGKLGLPAYGFVGAAMASVISELVGFIIILGFTIYNRYFTKFSLVKLRYFKSKIVGEILKIASPMMLQHLISFSAWFVIFLIIERMGERSLAISNIVRSLYITMMVPIWGFAEATNSLVSFLMGEKRFERVPILVRRSMLLSFSGVFLIVCLSYPFLHQIIGFYTTDANLIAATLPVVKVVMLGSIIMSLGFIAFMAISGTGNTLIAFGLEFSDIALYIVLAYILTVHLNANVTTMWFIETFYSGYMLIVCLLYLRFGKWREKIV